MVDTNRKTWNERQKELRFLLEEAGDLSQWRTLFLTQHAMVHAGAIAVHDSPSFADEVWQDTPEALIRRVPHNRDHSIAWCIWHVARIEDLTMNWLVAGSPQVVEQGNWFERMRITVKHTGNAMSADEIRALSTALDLDVLWSYRLEVGRRTQEIVKQLEPAQLKRMPDPAQLQRMLDEGFVIERGIVDYWSRRTVAGLLLMPPTRHNFVHLNEAQQLKQRRN